MDMNTQHKSPQASIDHSQAVSVADALYLAVSPDYPSRPLFFLMLDELYLDLCAGRRDGNFTQQLHKNWPARFPGTTWTDALSQLLDQYQRACRKWVWMLFTGRWDVGERQLEAMDAILTIHRRLLDGPGCPECEQDSLLIRLELRCTMGASAWETGPLTDHLRQSDFDYRLGQLRTGCIQRQAGGRADEVELPLRHARDTLMWMRLVSMQLGEVGKSSREAVREAACTIWESVMETGSQKDAGSYIARLEKNTKLPFGLIRYPYLQIRDISAKVTAQLQFCAAYAIACTLSDPVDSQVMLNNTIELLKSSFRSAEQLQDIQESVKRILRRYCDGTGSTQITPAAANYFRRHYDLVEECFEHLRQLDEDDVSIVENEIARKKDRAAMDIALMYQEREDEAFGHLMAALADPIHGNVIGQLYRIAEGAAEVPAPDELRHLLNNLFLLMQQKKIMPVWDEGSLYPGWSVRGKPVVNEIRRKERE